MGGRSKPSPPPPSPPPPPPAPVPEVEALSKANEKKAVKRRARSGRASTILSDSGGSGTLG